VDLNQPTQCRARTPRTSARQAVTLPALLTWKDQRGATRFASVVTRDVSELGVFVQCPSPVSLPLYKLVHFQFERDSREADRLPDVVRSGRVLSAVYRVEAPAADGSQGIALRLMIDPGRLSAAPLLHPARASA
jgi:hypothetical protein